MTTGHGRGFGGMCTRALGIHTRSPARYPARGGTDEQAGGPGMTVKIEYIDGPLAGQTALLPGDDYPPGISVGEGQPGHYVYASVAPEVGRYRWDDSTLDDPLLDGAWPNAGTEPPR